MNKERIKSAALVFLVMMNFILGAKILTDKKLWPYGYNFFVSLENSSFVQFFNRTSDRQITKTHLTMPEQIIVNTGDQTTRIAVNSDGDIFNELCDIAGEIISDALKAETRNIFFSPKKEWISVLNGKSVCFNYAVAYETSIMGEFFGVKSTNLSQYVPILSRIVVATDKSVYFEEMQTGNFFKVTTTKETDKLLSIINKVSNSRDMKTAIINYSVDLRFDEAFGIQKAVLAPTIPVYSTPVAMPILYAVNPFLTDTGEIDREVLEKLLPIFKINSNTVSRYPEADGTIVYVENNGILKINPNGVLYYQSTDSKGFSLSSDESYIDTINALANFTDKISSTCLDEHDLYLSSVLSENTDTVRFDYRANGVPVQMDYGGYQNAVTAEIKNGALKSYVQVLRKYVSGSERVETPGYIESLDTAIEKYSQNMNNIEIQRVYLAYTDNGDFFPKYAQWTTDVKSIEINEEELK